MEKHYPIELSHFKNFDGRLFYDSTTNKFTLIKPNWSGQSEYIYSWFGLEEENYSGVEFAQGMIYDFAYSNENFYFLSQNKENSILYEADKNFNILSKLEFENLNQNLTFLNINRNRLLNVGGELVSLKPLKKLDKENIISFVSDSGSEFKLVHDKQFIILKKNEKIIQTFQNVKNGNLHIFNNSLIVVLENTNNRLTLYSINTDNGKIVQKSVYETKNTSFTYSNGFLYLLAEKSNQLYFQKYNVLDNHSLRNEFALPVEFINPQKVIKVRNSIFVLFANGIVSLNENLEITTAFISQDLSSFSNDIDLYYDAKILILSTLNQSSIFNTNNNQFWWLKRIIDNFGLYLLVTFFILLLIILVQKYRHNQRILNEILELPSSGFLIILDKYKKVRYFNQQAKRLLHLDRKSVYSTSIVKIPVLRKYPEVFSILNTTYKTGESQKKKITFKVGNLSKDYICYTNYLQNIVGQKRGVILSGLDITEQLEKNRLLNWAQLVHDMQTNLSTIKLNAEQIDLTVDSNISKRKKILNQTNILFQKVRDIVTVGRSDKTDIQEHKASEICDELMDEFAIREEQIKFETVCKNFVLKCDKRKLLRALRNSVENSIKAFKNKAGNIKISTYYESNDAIFEIVDDGPGMKEEVKNKMLTPYFTTSKKEGGSGIGTMIMQQVMEQHNGHIEVESEFEKGTIVKFVLPKAVRSKDINNLIKKL